MKTTPKEKPIIFQGVNVTSILAKLKTQTRRLITPAPHPLNGPIYGTGFTHAKGDYIWKVRKSDNYGTVSNKPNGPDGWVENCPYGKVGDVLWVREAWFPDAPRDGTWGDVQFYGCGATPLSDIPKEYRKPAHVLYQADGKYDLKGWKSPIHMPRWASRISLTLTEIKIHRLNDMSEGDAINEGVFELDDDWISQHFPEYAKAHSDWRQSGKQGKPPLGPTPLARFKALWDSIHGEEAWNKNPWVWALTFKLLEVRS
jgi:hypothetical protein